MIDWRARRRDIYHSNSLSDCEATCRWGILCFILIFLLLLESLKQFERFRFSDRCILNRSTNLND
jgi:hypothetical protein